MPTSNKLVSVSENRIKHSTIRLKPLEIIAKAIGKENILKDYRAKRQDLFIDRLKHMSLTGKALRKDHHIRNNSNNCTDNKSIISKKNASFASESPVLNLFYHPYSFTPHLINKNYKPHMRKYTDQVPKQSMGDICIHHELMNDINSYSKSIRLGSYAVSNNYCPIRLNQQANNSSSSTYGDQPSDNRLRTPVISNYSQFNKHSDDSSNKLSSRWTQKFCINLKCVRPKSIRKYSSINNEIMKNNNQISINCVHSKLEEALQKKKIMMSSKSKSIILLQKDKSYQRIKVLEQKIYALLKKKE